MGLSSRPRGFNNNLALSMEDIFSLMKIVGWQGASASLDIENRNISLDKNI